MQNTKANFEAQEPDPAQQAARKIRLGLAALALSPYQVSKALGVDPGQTCRICNGEFKRVGGHAKEVLDYVNSEASRLGIDLDEALRLEERIRQTAMDLWDQTPAGGQRLLTMLESIKSLLRVDGEDSSDAVH